MDEAERYATRALGGNILEQLNQKLGAAMGFVARVRRALSTNTAGQSRVTLSLR